MRNAGKAALTARRPEKIFAEMLNAIGTRLSDIASSDNEVDGEDMEDDMEDTELG